MAKQWNPYYVAYAWSNGHSPAAQVTADREAYPGGMGCGFILWMAERRRAWRAESHVSDAREPRSPDAVAHFQQWLAEPRCG